MLLLRSWTKRNEKKKKIHDVGADESSKRVAVSSLFYKWRINGCIAQFITAVRNKLIVSGYPKHLFSSGIKQKKRFGLMDCSTK